MCTVAEPSFMAQYEYNTCTRKVLPKIKTNTAEKKALVYKAQTQCLVTRHLTF